MKQWYKSKTIIIAILTGVLGVIIAFETQFPGIGWMIIAKSFIDILLRMVTSTKIE